MKYGSKNEVGKIANFIAFFENNLRERIMCKKYIRGMKVEAHCGEGRVMWVEGV